MKRLLAALLAPLLTIGAAPPPDPAALFSGFRYQGADPADRLPLAADQYRNPVLAGFHPDPAITRVGDDFYLITSSFGYWPGLPIFHSRDLVSWRQIGAAVTRREQMDLTKLYPSDGLYGPDLKYHDGLFYALSTCVECGGNFVVTAHNPAGPWSQPHWLGFEGIDPSIFFDADGRAYILNNGPPVGTPRWSGHRAIWLQEIDLATLTMIGPRTVVVDGGVDLAQHPEWIEGPHLFRHDGFYYLIAAEGGTQEGHSEVVFRSRTLRGPYQPGPSNPILTQRDLPADRAYPVGSTGHADMIELKDGRWWAVFLGTRPYAPGTYNTGRDTFLLPVMWKNGWPTILAKGHPVPRVANRPALTRDPAPATPLSGGYTYQDRFASATLAPGWTMLRTPRWRWWRVGHGALALTPRADALGSLGQPSLLMIRQAHANATAEVTLRFAPAGTAQAGLTAFQDERRFYAIALASGARGRELRLTTRLTKDEPPQGRQVATVPLPGQGAVRLRVATDGPTYRFTYARPGEPRRPIGPALDGTRLSTRDAGGFTGTMIGLFAYKP